MTRAASVTPSNYAAIQAAILDIAVNKAGWTGNLVPNGSKLGELPTMDDITLHGTPFVSVRPGRLVGWLDGNERGIGTTQPIWHFDLYMVFGPYAPDNPQHVTVEQALVTLQTTFMAEYDLEATCFNSSPHSAEVVYLTISSTEYLCAKVTVQATEILDIQYV